jgi:spore coat protein U-like protein
MTFNRNRSNVSALALTSLLTLGTALANPPAAAIGGQVPTVPKRISSLVDIKLDSLTTRTNAQQMAWASPSIMNQSKQSVGVNIRVTVDSLNGKPSTTINQTLNVPANTLAATDILLPVFACAKITVNVTPSSSYTRDLDPSNNEKTAMLPCVK